MCTYLDHIWSSLSIKVIWSWLNEKNAAFYITAGNQTIEIQKCTQTAAPHSLQMVVFCQVWGVYQSFLGLEVALTLGFVKVQFALSLCPTNDHRISEKLM